jgi:hypothetical protein
VLATDGLGQQLLSAPAALRVDGLSPLARVRVRGGRRVTVRVADADSGLRPKATAVEFGDGDTERGGAAFDHVYPRAGLFRISVRARDAAGNRTARRFEVRVR